MQSSDCSTYGPILTHLLIHRNPCSKWIGLGLPSYRGDIARETAACGWRARSPQRSADCRTCILNKQDVSFSPEIIQYTLLTSLLDLCLLEIFCWGLPLPCTIILSSKESDPISETLTHALPLMLISLHGKVLDGQVQNLPWWGRMEAYLQRGWPLKPLSASAPSKSPVFWCLKKSALVYMTCSGIKTCIAIIQSQSSSEYGLHSNILGRQMSAATNLK